MEYTIVTGKFLSQIISHVNEKIKDGWTPQGGISESVVDSGAPDTFFIQAMIKKQEITDESDKTEAA